MNKQKKICNCGSNNLLLVDHEPLAIFNLYEARIKNKTGNQIDDEIRMQLFCQDCGKYFWETLFIVAQKYYYIAAGTELVDSIGDVTKSYKDCAEIIKDGTGNIIKYDGDMENILSQLEGWNKWKPIDEITFRTINDFLNE